MTVPSSIPLVKKTFVNGLVGLSWPVSTMPNAQPVQVSYGEPAVKTQEVVWVGDSFGEGDDHQDYWDLGAAARDEEYALSIWVGVNRGDELCEDAVERAFALFGAIETFLLARIDLGLNPPVVWTQLRQPSHLEELYEQGYGCVIKSALKVRARI